MNEKNIKNVAVLGAGILGHGIAQIFLTAGYDVYLYDTQESQLHKAEETIKQNIQTLRDQKVSKGEIVFPLQLSTDLAQVVAEADLVIEAIPEILALKIAIFEQLDKLCPKHTIIASNSSSLVPSEYGINCIRQEKIIGMHFFNPPYLLPLVEIVKGPKTSTETINIIEQLLIMLNMKPVLINQETPGFIGNRLQFALLKEAIKIVEEGVASPEDVDTVVKYGFGRRLAALGPFEVFDFGGWDTIAKVWSNITQCALPALIAEKVASNQFGVKSKQGFYHWDDDKINNFKQHLTQLFIMLDKFSMPEHTEK